MAIINPARAGFFKESKLAKEMIKPEASTLRKKYNIQYLPEKVFNF